MPEINYIFLKNYLFLNELRVYKNLKIDTITTIIDHYATLKVQFIDY